MKKQITIILIGILTFLFMVRPASAAFPILSLLREAAIKAIKAADLAIQRQQNKVIWLQNAQKVIENSMSKLKLDEISDWTERQRSQYQQYFDELWRVKALISYYKRVSEITQRQILLVKEFQRTWSLLKNDKHFSADEILYMGKVYAGILKETVKNVDQMMIIVNSFKTQMSDAKRLELINEAAERVDQNYSDLKQFNRENVLLSLQRSSSEQERRNLEILYGLRP
ncbi:conjugal transfer protein TraI [uncultured Pedobacter sp.]|uniref:conjugal transfer protein TraI n=1 Tax=uncultured Pedobacter sp. TaxID=246139 RepID=UPI0026121423|nr:conjugal transfer protein TraI [uncultured Pedobacter sp.]